jgi:hypothetical protein
LREPAGISTTMSACREPTHRNYPAAGARTGLSADPAANNGG